MATENKTSLALHSFQFFDPDNLKNPFDIQLKAVIEYAKRMEEALELIASEGSLDTDAELARKKLKAKEALSFDPL